MTKRVVTKVAICALLAACSGALGIDNSLPPATQELLQMYPGAKTLQEGGRIKMIFGMPMTPGQNAAAASEAFIQLHADAFGMGAIELTPEWAADTADGKHSIFSYREKIDGYPVELGDVRVMVLNGETPRVVFAGGNLAPRPAGGFIAPTVTTELASAIAQASQDGEALDTWYGAPKLVVYQGSGAWIDPVLTWRITGDSTKVPGGATRTFFIDAHTGEIVASRNEVSHTDVGGTVTGMATPGVEPDVATNPPVPMQLPEIMVGVNGGNVAYSDRSGVFWIPGTGVSPVTLNSSIGAAGGYGGRWVQVTSNGQAGISAAQPGVLPPGPAALVFNPIPGGANSTTTAQVNAFVNVNIVHDYFKDRAPTFTGLDQVINAHTGVAGSCNANFTPGVSDTPCTTCNLNFFNAGDGCNNSAYASVIYHEYGHFIVNRLNRMQLSFGEGYGDTTAMLILDDPVIARNFYQWGAPIRTPMNDNVQYPCTTTPSCGQEIHCCGELLAVCWYQTRLNMGSFYGSWVGLNLTRQLHVSWSLMTLGGEDVYTAAGPRTLTELLLVDDDDGIISNGTPNYSRICAAFNAHGILNPFAPATCSPGGAVCYANCDGSTANPILNINDFQCFLNAFSTGQAYANCDNSTSFPILNANDFQCYMNRYAAGCP